MDVQRVAARLFAILLLLVVLPLCWYYAAQAQWRNPIGIGSRTGIKGEWTINAVSGAAERAGVHPGDIVDFRGAGKRDVFMHEFAAGDSPVQYRIIHNGVERTVTLTPTRVDLFASFDRAFGIGAVLLQGTITILVAAIVLWRRPDPVSFALGLYALGPLYTADVIAVVTWLPDALFWPVASALDVAVGIVPALALICFAMLFPSETLSERGRRWVAAVSALLAGVCVVAYAFSLASLDLLDADNVFWSILVPAAANLAVIVIVLFKYNLASGEQRRRIGWVLTGLVISGICYVISDINATGFLRLPALLAAASVLASAALPLALAYAILRHRVLDIGFALNRTLVYACVTGLVVVVISAVDWFSGRYFESSKLSLAVEGAVTIGFGVALNWFHRRIERGVDRVLFRERHRAQTRIEARIRALDFAESSATVDQALVDEAFAIMHLASAAVFRVDEAGDFVRRSARGWDGAAPVLTREHVLLRTLRAEEETVVLADHAIDLTEFPHGTARPDVAIPIGARHQLLGCVLYGHREGDATLDPEERALLERLAHACAVAYDAIEAAHWRRRALAREGAPAPAAAL